MFFYVVMPYEDTRMLEFSQYQKFNEAPSTTCAYFECLIKNGQI